MDRPGYGDSDPQLNISPLQFAEQIRNLIQHLKIQEFSILSISGGAPYSMAIAFLMKGQVKKVSSIGGVAPLTIKNFKFMNPQQKKAWALQNFVPNKALHFLMSQVWQRGLDQMDKLLFTKLERFSEWDRKVLLDPELGPHLFETTKQALSKGPSGILADMRVYSKSWGFPLRQLDWPVTLWHGQEDDIVSYKYAEEMQSILSKAQLFNMPNEGHYSLLVNYRDQIIADNLGHDLNACLNINKAHSPVT
jgi:pimeloyl-ACP methyl ester carboxylesterase